jgi:hypothetical protein
MKIEMQICGVIQGQGLHMVYIHNTREFDPLPFYNPRAGAICDVHAD